MATNLFAPDGLGTTTETALTTKDGNSVLSRVYITLTSAQVLALNATPVTVIPAPATGKFIDVSSYNFRVNFNSVQYTGANNIEMRFTNGSGTKVGSDIPAASLNAASTAASYYQGTDAAGAITLNAPVVLSVPTANPAAGNSTVTIEIFYSVRDLNS